MGKASCRARHFIQSDSTIWRFVKSQEWTGSPAVATEDLSLSLSASASDNLQRRSVSPCCAGLKLLCIHIAPASCLWTWRQHCATGQITKHSMWTASRLHRHCIFTYSTTVTMLGFHSQFTYSGRVKTN